jgi:hypothetical protein
MKAKSGRKPKKESPAPLLRKWQRNDLFEAIQAVGLDPRDFDLADTGTQVQIKHKRSESIFIIGGRPGHYVGRSVVGDGPDWPYDAYSWQALPTRVSTWLQEVKRDLETPDLWAELRREVHLLGVGSNEVTENTLFTQDEQKQIAERLRGLAKHVNEASSLSEAQKQILNEKIDYLVDGSRRLGRNDWLNTFNGVILGYLLSTALPPDVARGIFSTCLRAIGLLYPELPLLD